MSIASTIDPTTLSQASAREINGNLYIACSPNPLQVVRDVYHAADTIARFKVSNAGLRAPSTAPTLTAGSLPTSSSSTTYTATSVTDANPWDLSGVVVGWTVTAGGSTGTITAIGTNSLTVDSWVGGTPANGSVATINIGGTGGKTAGEYSVVYRFYSENRLIWSNPSPSANVTVTPGSPVILVSGLPTAASFLDDDVTHIELFCTLVSPAFTDLLPDQSGKPRGTFYFELRVPLGSTTAVLSRSDQWISGNDTLTGRDQVPPDTFGICFWRNRAWFAGQRSYRARVTLTNGSKVMSVATAAAPPYNRIYNGSIGRAVKVLRLWYTPFTTIDKGLLIEDITASNTARLASEWDGTTAEYLVEIIGEPNTVWASEIDTTLGSAGAPLPESVPRFSYALAHFDLDDGQEIRAMLEHREFLCAWKEGKWGYISDAGQNFRTVELIGARALWDRNVCADTQGNLYFIGSDGSVRRISAPTPSEDISSDQIKEFFRPPPGRSDDDCFDMVNIDRAVMKFHPGQNWLVLIGPRRNRTNNDLCLIYDLTVGRWFRFDLMGSIDDATGLETDEVTVDITQAMAIFELAASSGSDGGWQLYLGGHFTIGGLGSVARLLKMESGLVDEAPDGSDRRISFTLDTYPFTVDGGVPMQLVETSIQSRPAAAGEISIQAIADRDDGNEQEVGVAQTRSLTLRNNRVLFPPHVARAVRVRMSGQQGSASGVFEWRQMRVRLRAVGRSLK